MANITVSFPVKVDVNINSNIKIVDHYIEKSFKKSNLKIITESELEKLTDEPLEYIYHVISESGVATPNLFIKTPSQEIMAAPFTIEDLC